MSEADTRPETDAEDTAESNLDGWTVLDSEAAQRFLRELLGGPDQDGMTSTPFTHGDDRHALNADDLHMINVALMYCASRLVTGGRAQGAFAFTRLAERIEHMRQHGGSVVVVPF